MSTTASPDLLERHGKGIIAALARAVESRVSRRGFLVRAAVAGSAVSVGGVDFVLRPQDAYATVCGPASSCSSGWTAFCCSIDRGVNQCPPGSFAGGWWKADGASMCGGSARYIVDCQARCECGCGGGSAFCRESCWNCEPGCAHDKCDHRRHCRNVFRYGQCNQHIGCSGPVLCRAVSCTPPWQWADCSRASATDNATVAHNATCLPNWNAMQRRYTALGSQGSVLGASVRTPVHITGGKVQRYTGGWMFWSQATGAHYLRGPILKKYRRLHLSKSMLRFPTSDSHPVKGGYAATFQRGGIYQVPGSSAKVMAGAIHRAWLRSGGPSGPVGMPTMDQRRVRGPNGRYVLCEHGSVFQGAAEKACALWGGIHAKYRALGFRKGVLGFPRSTMLTSTDRAGRRCTYADFQNGTIVTRADGGTAAVWGPIDRKWRELHGIRGPLGVPMTDPRRVAASVVRSVFAHGHIDWNTATGQVIVVVT